MKGTDLEVISILRMLSSKIDDASGDLIAELLYHPSTQVRLEALRLIKSRSNKVIRERLENLLQEEELDRQIKEEAVKTLCKNGYSQMIMKIKNGH